MMLLEWAAFFSTLVSVYLYGKGGMSGPISGMVGSILFIKFGHAEGIPAAIFSNIIFLQIHTINLRRVTMDDQKRTKKDIEKFFSRLGRLVMPDKKTAKWWNNGLDGQSADYFHQIPLKLALVHSEVSEALEHHRTSAIDEETKGVTWSPDKKLPHLPGVACELADVILRVVEISEACGLPLGQALAEKMAYNQTRPDHKPANMAKPGGKRY